MLLVGLLLLLRSARGFGAPGVASSGAADPPGREASSACGAGSIRFGVATTAPASSLCGEWGLEGMPSPKAPVLGISPVEWTAAGSMAPGRSRGAGMSTCCSVGYT